MGMISCRECNSEVSSKAEKCPNCGIKHPSKGKYIYEKIDNILGTIVVVVIIFAAIGYFSDNQNNAKCIITGEPIQPEVFIINDEPDAGYTYKLNAKNVGDTGEITVEVTLSTSEGEFNRKQTLAMDSGEQRKLSFSFPEPTVNASNIQGRASCSPK